MSDRIKIFNGQIIHQNRIQSGGCILIENGKIIDVLTTDIDFPDAKLVDAQGNYISPGFIDIHKIRTSSPMNMNVNESG